MNKAIEILNEKMMAFHWEAVKEALWRYRKGIDASFQIKGFNAKDRDCLAQAIDVLTQKV